MSNTEAYIKDKLTHVWHDIEHWQRDNHYILSGYRAQSNSYISSVYSLLYLHNESINVYSHLTAAIAFAVSAIHLYGRLKPLYKTASCEDVAVFACFFIGAIFCLSMSATFHLLCNHSLSVSKFGNQLDYVGIVLLIWGSFVPSIYYGFAGRQGLVWLYWTMITLIGTATGYVTISPSFRTPEWRPVRAALFVGMGLSAIIPVFHGVITLGYVQMNKAIGLSWLISQGALYIIGAALYAARVPERVWPGTFDLFFSSHQIFHLLVVAAATTHLRGLLKAFHAKHQGPFAESKVYTGARIKVD